MDAEKIINLIVSLLAGLAAAIPIVYELVKYIKKAIQEENWGDLLNLVMQYMAAAEKKFESGADRKEWVMMMIKASADTINFPVDLEEVGKLIDSLCDLTKVVNRELPEAPKLKK